MLHTSMQKKAALGVAAALSLLVSAGASAQATAPSHGAATGTMAASGAMSSGALARADRSFIEKAAIGDMAEVELGKLAQQKATNEQVKQFGARMVQDHGKANDELKQIASSKNVQVPTSMDKKHQKDMDRLQKLSGASFDREYMKYMVSDHKQDISDFQKEAKSGKDSDVKGFAAKTLPTLQEHLQLAQAADGAVKGSKAPGAASGNH